MTGIPKGVVLKKGKHDIKVMYYDDKGKAHLKLFWKQPGMVNYEVIPYSYLFVK